MGKMIQAMWLALGYILFTYRRGGGLQKDKEDCCGEIRMTNVEVIA
jgi:hypothetical protein